MSCVERADDFESRRERLRAMSDEALHDHFWSLVEKIVEPLIEEVLKDLDKYRPKPPRV